MKIIRIGATWCGSCLSMKKVYAELEEMYKDIEWVNLDFDFNIEEIIKYNPGNIIPVLIIFKDDVEVERLIGDYTKEQIIEHIEAQR